MQRQQVSGWGIESSGALDLELKPYALDLTRYTLTLALAPSLLEPLPSGHEQLEAANVGKPYSLNRVGLGV